MKKVITSALVISGATALSTMEVEATENGFINLPGEDTEQLQDLEVIEKALRQYTNPLHRIHAQMENYQPEDHIMYKVKEGDTISGISIQFGIPISEIVRENNIRNKHRISIGQNLVIRLKEQHYFVQHGESLEEIAGLQGVPIEDIIAYNQDLKQTNYATYPGQHLKIPTAPPEPAHQPLSSPRNVADKNKVTIASRSETTAARDMIGYSWPVIGTITSSYGTRWGRMHNGIDISHSKKSKAEIVAAGAGVVTEAYYHRGGYGNLVIVDHGSGIQTYYAHLSEIEVKAGEQLNKGDIVGYMGRTGRATGYHLHFEIRKDNKPLNPIKYLPTVGSAR